MAELKLCIDCRHYYGQGVCGLAFENTLKDPVEGGLLANQPVPASTMRQGGYCGMGAIFWEEIVSDEIKQLRDTINKVGD